METETIHCRYPYAYPNHIRIEQELAGSELASTASSRSEEGFNCCDNQDGPHVLHYSINDTVESDRGNTSMNESNMAIGESSLFLQELRASVGDYGLALFAPLLDFADAHPYRVEGEGWNSRQQGSSSPSTFSDTNTTMRRYAPNVWRSSEGQESKEYDTDESDSESDESISSIHLMQETPNCLRDCPRILSLDQMKTLHRQLPDTLRDRYWERCFCIGLHGDSFCTLLQKCAPFNYSIVVMRTASGDILGGFASQTWRSRDDIGQGQRNAYYGTGQSFVFASHPEDTDICPVAASQDVTQIDGSDCQARRDLQVYKWTGENDYCQICDSERRVLCMGGVGEFGWIASDDFTAGQTGACATFGNPPLCPAKSSTFAIAEFEIYGIRSSICFS